MYQGRRYKLVADYGLETEQEIDYHAKSLKGARSGAIKWLQDNGTRQTRVTIFICGNAVGYVFNIPLKPHMLKPKGKYARYGWHDEINGFVALNTNGTGRPFEKE